MPLPEDAKKDSIEARYNNGVLTVKILRNKTLIPKAEAQKIMVK
jgi:HSP20 family molecular chaperone IbpA